MDALGETGRMPVVPGPREDFVAWALTSRETGEVVIWQVPNLPSVLAQVAAVATLAAPGGSRLRRAGLATTLVASTWWGTDELVRGVDPLRRALGGAALVGVAAAVGVAASRRLP